MTASDSKKEKNRKIVYYIFLFVIFAAIGAVVAGKITSARREAAKKEADNLALIAKYTAEAEELTAETERVRNDLADIESRYRTVLAKLKETDRDFYNLLNMYNKNLQAVRLMAGLTSVSGSGIVIKLDDSGLVRRSLVHDTYLSEILNVLKTAGAQAISINGERIIPTSEVLCLGPSIRVNGVRLFAPYRISAVGNSELLMKAFLESRIYSTIVSQNLIYDVQAEDRIVIGSFTGDTDKLISKLY